MRYTARIVTVNLCELLSRPKVSQRSLILSGNYSAALRENSLRLCERRTTVAGYFSRQAAKAAKVKHEYFCGGLPRRMLF